MIKETTIAIYLTTVTILNFHGIYTIRTPWLPNEELVWSEMSSTRIHNITSLERATR